MSTQEIQVSNISRDSLDDWEFCHLCLQDSLETYCGRGTEGKTHGGFYLGEAICSDCGYPTCPRCAVLAAIEAQLVFGDAADH